MPDSANVNKVCRDPSEIWHVTTAVHQCIKLKDITISDLLSENPALPTNIEFELEAILSVHVIFPVKVRLLHQGGNYRGLALHQTEL